MKRLLRALAEWAPILGCVAVLLSILGGLIVWSAIEYRKPCEDWAAQNGLGSKAATLTCETGPDSSGDLTEAEFQVQQNDALNEAYDIINQDGGL